jgi:hypothetical protein
VSTNISSAASLLGRSGAHSKWAQIPVAERPAATRAARDAFNNRFLDQAGGDPVRAANLRKAYFAKLALKSAQARARKAGGRVA